jgi:predicted adenylyl cyclase CyaB
MRVINAEIKARSENHSGIREVLKARHADFKGRDHQVDTYYIIKNGRLKLREGSIENNLIYYLRPDQEGPKTSRCVIQAVEPGSALKEILESALGTLVVVDKKREIYFINNIKVHLDEVEGLGTFVEIEAQSQEGDLSEEYLLKQCRDLMADFKISDLDLEADSYSDLLLKDS